MFPSLATKVTALSILWSENYDKLSETLFMIFKNEPDKWNISIYESIESPNLTFKERQICFENKVNLRIHTDMHTISSIILVSP